MRASLAFRTTGRSTAAAFLLFGAACGDPVSPRESPTGEAPGGFTLSAEATAVTVLQGGVAEARLGLARDIGFAGSVALAVTGAPAGVTAIIEPSTTTGSSATLVVTAGGGVPEGGVALTVTATATGRAAQTATVQFGVLPSPGGEGNVMVDFSACPSGPVWFAFQDGDAGWTQLVGASGVYRFPVTSGKGGYAFASAGPERTLTVRYATQDELTRSTITICRRPSGKTVLGTLGGLGAGQVAYVGLGGPNPDPEGWPLRTQSFTLVDISEGPQDLVAYRSASPLFAGTGAGGERAVIRRDQEVPRGGSLGHIDFDGPESFAPSTARVTVTDSPMRRTAHWMSYLTGPACAYHDLYYDESGGAEFTMRGIPAAQQRATDLHRLDVYTADGQDSRGAAEIFHSLTDRVVAFPPALLAPAITTLPGSHRRLRASLTLPPEYRNGEMLLLMAAYGELGAFAYVSATTGWLGGSAVTLAVPDLGGTTGWRSAFLPPPDMPVFWYLHSTSSTGGATDDGICAENARYVYASFWGRS